MTNGEGGMVMVPVTLLERCVMWFNTLANYGMDAAFSDGERTPNARAMDELASQISTLLADNAIAAAPSAQPNAAPMEGDCPACKGSGEAKGYDYTRGPDGCEMDIPCPTCNGTGNAPAGAAPSTGNEGLVERLLREAEAQRCPDVIELLREAAAALRGNEGPESLISELDALEAKAKYPLTRVLLGDGACIYQESEDFREALLNAWPKLRNALKGGEK
jgi:hypothetical protein